MKLITTVVLLILVFSFGVCADEGKTKPFSGNIKYEKYYVDYEVNANGTYTENHDIVIAVLTDEGVKSANQEDISYSESLEEIVNLSAYTLKKDGMRIDVPADNIQERAAVAGGGPMYSDIKTKVIIFPDVATGDKVGFSCKSIHNIALFPGHFSMTHAFTKFMVYDDVRITISVPVNSLKLQVFAAGVEGGKMPDKDGRLRWAWTYKNKEIATPEDGSVGPLDYGPRIIVSSFKDYGAIAAAYEERARPKAAVTEKVRALAEELTHGITGTREQAKALYTWVAQNIHYAGNCIGIGSVVPHDTEMILANKLGDCKDHTALLQALLAAKGIESTAALVNSGDTYKLPEVPSVNVFNHVINYIPSLDLYADSTSEYTPFGLLPEDESGKPIVHTANFTGIKQTPSTDYKVNRSYSKTVIHINKDGSADGETKSEEAGMLSVWVRAWFASVQPNMEDRVVRSVLSRNGYTGTGTIIKADPREMSDHYAYSSKYHLDNAINLPGPGALYVSPVFFNALPISSAVRGLNMPGRTLNYGCLSGTSIEEYTVDLPENIKVVALPKGVHITGNNVNYDSTYSQEGNIVTVIRKLEVRTLGNLCTPEDDKKSRPVKRNILKDLKAQVIYQPIDDSQQ